ncbi:MAG: iron ABC transporter permease [Candidatus Heimdallarchaeota archaeon]|nr:iron ABC transporter permease [Candidatus Heimdallarchaeota archaeon]
MTFKQRKINASLFLDYFSAFSSSRLLSKIFYFFVLAFFLFLILTPTVYVIFYLFGQSEVVIAYFQTQPEAFNMIQEALFYSVSVAVIVSIVDLIFGIPLAWLLVRGMLSGRIKTILNILIELPLAVPTAGLGLSVALFWGVVPGISSPPFSLRIITSALPILVLFHFTTTFPYVVRSLAAILEEIDVYLEIAGRTCGASSFTAARTITFPLFRSGVATSLILSLAKSLSDTGGVMSVLSATQISVWTGTVLIGTWKHEIDIPARVNLDLIPPLAFLCVAMIFIALILMSTSRLIAKRVKIPIKKVWYETERKLSEKRSITTRNTLAIVFLGLFVLIPSFFLILYIPIGFTSSSLQVDWFRFFGSIANSLIVSIVATTINVLLGVPLGIFISRKKNRISNFFNVLVDIPYVVPSSALGFSVGLFWNAQQLISNQLFFVIMAHSAMTFPFIVRNVIGGLEDLDLYYEETARTLGARNFQIFYLITLPIIKFSIIAGIIMSFTRSVGETGATLAVATGFETAPVFIVNLINEHQFFNASLAIIALIVCTSLVILVLRTTFGQKKVRRV